MQTDAFVRMPKFCSLVAPSPCPIDQCIFPPDPERLISWVNTVCNLTAEAQTLWNQSTSERHEAFRKLKPLDSIGNRPSCSDACPGLVTSLKLASSVSKSLFNATQFCGELVDVDGCREACTFGKDPRKLFGWLNNTCGNETYDREFWRDVTVAKEVAWVSQWIPALFPWNWTVQLEQPATLATIGIQVTDPSMSSEPYLSIPPSGPGVCNTSTSEKLGVFAAVNIVSALLLPVLGRRTVVNKLTFGLFGRPGSRGWPVSGVFSAALNVFANLANAYVIRKTPGYESVPFGALALLWCTRPRLAWLAVFLATIQAEEGMYLNCAASAITSEAILQILGAVYFGISANYGRKKRFYYVGHLDPYPRGVDAHVMYAGALLWLLMSMVTLFACIVCIVGLGEVITNTRKMMEGLQKAAAASGNAVAGPLQRWVNGPSGKWVPKRLRDILNKQKKASTRTEPRRLTADEIRQIETVFNAGIIFLSFLAQWLFWAGFVKAAQERYEFYLYALCIDVRRSSDIVHPN